MRFYILLGTIIPYFIVVIAYEKHLKKNFPNYKKGSNTLINSARFISFKYHKKDFKEVVLGIIFFFIVIGEIVFAITTRA